MTPIQHFKAANEINGTRLIECIEKLCFDLKKKGSLVQIVGMGIAGLGHPANSCSPVNPQVAGLQKLAGQS